MSKVFTYNALKQALLQGPKALEFVKPLHQLYCLLSRVLIQSTHIASPEVLIENRYTYKQQGDYLCFDDDFDNNNDDDDDGDDDDDDDDIPTTTPTTAAADLLLTLINQIPPIPSPPPPPSLPSLFNFSYSNVTPPRTTTDPSTDSDSVTPSSSALVIMTIPCYDSGTAILPTTSFERTTSYLLLSSHLLIPSQFLKLSYGEDHYCTVSTSKQRLGPTPVLPIPRTVTKISTPPLQAKTSRSVFSKDEKNYLTSLSSLVDIGLMMILTIMILPTIVVIILTILSMMFVMLPAVISTHNEPDVFPDDKTMNTARPPTSSMTIPLASSPSSYKKSGKRDDFRLQQRQFGAFIQKLQYSCIGSSCSGFQWITAILYKLSITIWTLWQFNNDGICLSASAWRLLLGVLQ